MAAPSQTFAPEILAALVKRHSHDLRNALNGMEMELTLLAETTDPTERAAAVHRMRQGMRCAEGMIRSFARKFIQEKKAAICASDLFEQWMSDAGNLLPERSIKRDLSAGQTVIEAETGLLRSLLGDLLALAAHKYPRVPLEAGCRLAEGRVVFSVACASDGAEPSHHDPLEQLLWSALQNFAARCNGVLEQAFLPAESRFFCRLILSPAPSGG